MKLPDFPVFWTKTSQSLRAQLFAWVTMTLVAVICLNLFLSFRSANATSNLVTDRTLLASARVIAEAVHADSHGTVQVDIPPAALEMFDTGHRDRVFYQVITAWGSLVAGYPDLPKTAKNESGEDGIVRGQDVRVVSLAHPIVGLNTDSDVSVTVAVTRNSQLALRNSLWFADFGQQLVLVLVAGLVTILGLQRGLAPILRLRDAVRDRGRDRLDPLRADSVQTELRPLVGALNDYMERVQGQMSAQRRFVANAAHQLRTPLALLSTQASVAAREDDARRREEALVALQNSTRHVARLASQLLTLSRAEPGSRRPRQDRIDLVETSRGILVDYTEQALSKDIDMGIEAEGKVWVVGDAPMLREMIVNLVDNAVRYTPSHGMITVDVRRQESLALLIVKDNGHGIPASERSQALERFYRVLGTDIEGSGLGLAIVKEVVEGSGGTVELDEAPGGGLLVTVKLPSVD